MYDAPGHHPAKLGPGCPGVRSQSLAVIHAIVQSYLPPLRWRLRSCLTAPHEAQAARPPGTAPRCSRHASGQPPSPLPLSCRLLPPPGASRNPPQRPVRLRSAGPPRFATQRPAPLRLTSRTTLLKLRPVGPGFAQADDPRRLRQLRPHRPRLLRTVRSAALHSLSRPLCLGTACLGLRERETGGVVVPAALAARHPPHQNFGRWPS